MIGPFTNDFLGGMLVGLASALVGALVTMLLLWNKGDEGPVAAKAEPRPQAPRGGPGIGEPPVEQWRRDMLEDAHVLASTSGRTE